MEITRALFQFCAALSEGAAAEVLYLLIAQPQDDVEGADAGKVGDEALPEAGDAFLPGHVHAERWQTLRPQAQMQVRRNDRWQVWWTLAIAPDLLAIHLHLELISAT